jgi:hypothetical protein
MSATIDPAVCAAEQIARRGVGRDVETMSIIIRNAYVKRTDEIKKEIEAHCRSVFEENFGSHDRHPS